MSSKANEDVSNETKDLLSENLSMGSSDSAQHRCRTKSSTNDDKVFDAWCNSLVGCIQELQTTSADATTSPSLSNFMLNVNQSMETDIKLLPTWISAIPPSQVALITSTAANSKKLLMRLNIPSSLLAFRRFVSTFQVDCGSQSTTHYNSTNVTLSKTSKEINGLLEDCFRRMTGQHSDSLVSWCSLADVTHRLFRSTSNSSIILEAALAKERTRFHSSKISQLERLWKLQILSSADDQKPLTKSFPDVNQIQSYVDGSIDDQEGVSTLLSRESDLRRGVANFAAELNSCCHAVQNALDEEESARIAYEAAIARRKEAQAKYDTLTKYIDSIDSQRDMLIEVCKHRIELDKYNIDSASHRLRLLANLQDVTNIIQAHLISPTLSLEIKPRLNNCFREFFSEQQDESQDLLATTSDATSKLIKLRIGKEIFRLWRQVYAPYCGSSENDEIAEMINKFEYELISREKMENPQSVTISADVLKQDNATVVLYFDHLVHETPTDHVENQKRVVSCVTALKNLLLVSLRAEKQDECKRRLMMIKCNDIVSPPFWVLPLVHSPSYLAKLWSLASEANIANKMVPLQLGSDQESDGMNSDSDAEELAAGYRRGYPKSSSNNRESAFLSSLLSPSTGDMLVAKILRRKQERAARTLASIAETQHMPIGNATRTAKRRRFSHEHDRKEKQSHSPNDKDEIEVDDEDDDNSEVNNETRVRTKFGTGILLEKKSECGIYKVQMFWNAVAYFNEDSIQVIDTPERVPNLTSKDINNSLQEVLHWFLSGEERRYKIPPVAGKIDSFLYAVVGHIVSMIGVQKIVADTIDVTPSMLSQWLHCRSSVMNVNLIEYRLIEWLDFHDQTGALATGLNRAKGIYKDIYAKKPISFDEERAKPVATHMDESEEESESSSDSESAASKVGVIASPIPVATSTPVASTSVASTSLPSTMTPAMGLLKPTRRPAKPSLLMAVPEEAWLRTVIKKIMKVTNATQASIGKFFADKYHVHIGQASVSGWLHFRISDPKAMRWRPYFVGWLNDKTSYLSDKEREYLIGINSKSNLPLTLPSRSLSSADNVDGMDVDEYAHEDTEIMSVDEEGENQAVENITAARVELALNPTQPILDTPISSEGPSNEKGQQADLQINPKISLLSSSESLICTQQLHTTIAKLANDLNLSNLSCSQQVGIGNSRITAICDRFLAKGHLEENEHARAFLLHLFRWIRNFACVNEALKLDLCPSCCMHACCFENSLLFGAHKDICHGLIDENISNRSLKKDKQEILSPSRIVAAEIPKIGDLNVVLASLPHFRETRGNQSRMIQEIENLTSVAASSNSHQPERSPSPLPVKQEHSQGSSDVSLLDIEIRKYCRLSVNQLDDLLTKIQPRSVDQKSNQTAARQPMATVSRGLPFDKNEVVVADVVQAGFHYHNCEVCKQSMVPRDGLVCGSCPCVYHKRCLQDDVVVEGTNWWCKLCSESDGAKYGRLMTNEEKTDKYSLMNKWILIFSKTLHRWRKGMIIDCYMQEKLYVLVKWWRTDNRGGKSHWTDISNAVILEVDGPGMDVFTPKRRPKPKRPTIALDAGVDEREEMAVQDPEPESEPESEPHREPNHILPQNESKSNAQARVAISRPNRIKPIKRPADELITPSDQEDAVSTPNPKSKCVPSEDAMSDTYLSHNSLQAALCAAGSACRAVDIAYSNSNTNVFVCTRPPGHHAGRFGVTTGCRSTGFCLLNNAAIAAIYSRVRWGVKRVAVVDIDVHFGNGTAEILKNDENAFFASVHMIYGVENNGSELLDTEEETSHGFFPAKLGFTEVSDNYLSVGVYPESKKIKKPKKARGNAETDEGVAPSNEQKALRGAQGYRSAIESLIIPHMIKFRPELLIISAGFDGFLSDPVGGSLQLSLEDYEWTTRQLTEAMNTCWTRSDKVGKVISLLEGGYDTNDETLGLAKCVVSHVKTLQLI